MSPNRMIIALNLLVAAACSLLLVGCPTPEPLTPQTGTTVKANDVISIVRQGPDQGARACFVGTITGRKEGDLEDAGSSTGSIAFRFVLGRCEPVGRVREGLERRSASIYDTRVFDAISVGDGWARPLEESSLSMGPLARGRSSRGLPSAVGQAMRLQLSVSPSQEMVTAYCEARGEHCMVLLDSRFRNTTSKSRARDLCAFFDEHIYPKCNALFGQDAIDVDGEHRVAILMTDLNSIRSGAMGVYWAPDRSSDASVGNGLDMFYVEDSYPVDVIGPVTAHEYQHMLSHGGKMAAHSTSREVTWLNESLSELAGLACGGRMRGEDTAEYLGGEAITSLTLWDRNDGYGRLRANYAGSQLFGMYLFDRFVRSGQRPSLFRDLVRSPERGIANLEKQTGIPFDTLYLDWCMALMLDDQDVTSDQRFQLPSIDTTNHLQRGTAWVWSSSSWDWPPLNDIANTSALPYEMRGVFLRHERSDTESPLTCQVKFDGSKAFRGQVFVW